MIRLASVMALFLSSILVTSVALAGLDQQLATLKAVGSEGAGNTAARQAWQQVSKADAASLPVILAALDDAGPLAANWLRASVDAIAERQLQKGENCRRPSSKNSPSIPGILPAPDGWPSNGFAGPTRRRPIA